MPKYIYWGPKFCNLAPLSCTPNITLQTFNFSLMMVGMTLFEKKGDWSWFRTSNIRKSQILGQCLFQGWPDTWSSSLLRAAMSWASLARYQRLIVTISTQLINIMVDQVPADEKEALTSDLMGLFEKLPHLCSGFQWGGPQNLEGCRPQGHHHGWGQQEIWPC